jgi:serine/threonine protein phosphatase PrpC
MGFFQRAARCKPHPLKALSGGEDAYVAMPYLMGVADGVGSWAARGVDSGRYSRTLMKAAHDYAAEEACYGNAHVAPQDALRHAYEEGKEVTGTSTVLLASICNQAVDVLCLGDSGCMIMRPDFAGDDEDVLYRSDEQQHQLNFPFQLGTASADRPEHAAHARVPVQAGDVVVLATDGIFDNVYDGDINQLIRDALRHADPADPLAVNAALNEACDSVVARASSNAMDKRCSTPFSDMCMMDGIRREGGKEDDMTIVLSVVGRHAEAARGTERVENAPAPYIAMAEA